MSTHKPSISNRELTNILEIHRTISEMKELPGFKQIISRWEPISMSHSVTVAANGRIITQEINDNDLILAVDPGTVITRTLHQIYVSLTKPLDKLIPPNTWLLLVTSADTPCSESYQCLTNMILSGLDSRCIRKWRMLSLC